MRGRKEKVREGRRGGTRYKGAGKKEGRTGRGRGRKGEGEEGRGNGRGEERGCEVGIYNIFGFMLFSKL